MSGAKIGSTAARTVAIDGNSTANMTTIHIADEKRWEVIAAFAFGCVFLVVVLLITWYKPTPTPFEYTVFRITISLAASGVGAILPGFLDVRFKNWLRAGGALALFVIVYFFSPAALSTTVVDPPPPSTDSKPRADEWLSLVDKKNYAGAYGVMGKGFRSKYPFSQFEELIVRERDALGTVKKRQFVSAAPYESPPGAARGHYRQYGYRTTFTNDPRPIYELVWLYGEENEWRVSGFYTVVKTSSGQFVPYEANNLPDS